MEQRSLKDQLAHFGRLFALLLNRTLMYQTSHPVIKQSVADALTMATQLLDRLSPLVFILNRGQFYMDEEPLDPRINVARIATLFKNNNLQSVSFEKGLMESELSIFAELFASLTQTSSAEVMKDTLIKRGVFNLKINHVTFKKVTEEDQIVSRDALKKVTPMMDSDDEQTRKRFMDTVLESVLSEEFAKTLNITNMMSNPKAFTQQMIEADLAGAMRLNEEIGQGPIGGAGVADASGGPAGMGDGQGLGAGAGGGTGPGGGTGTGSGTGTGTGPGGGTGTSSGTGTGTVPGGGIGTGSGTGTGAGKGSGTGTSSGTGTGAGPGGGTGTGSGTGTSPGGSGATATGSIGEGAGLHGQGPVRRTGTGTVIDHEGLSQDRTDDEGPGKRAQSGPQARGGASPAIAAGSTTGPAVKHGTGFGAAGSGIGIGANAGASSSAAAPGSETSTGSAAATAPGAGDGTSPGPAKPGGAGHGSLLIHQLELMHQEVDKHLHGEGEIGIAELAQAIFDMKKQLLEGIQAQKALGIAYANEAAIVDAANKMADQVLVELIKEEYQAGKISTQRLAYVIRRLIPEAAELRRMLPLIKKALLSEGMPVAEYLSLIHELRNELQNEELIRVLQESSESIGVEGDFLIEEVRRNPTQAAEMIYLASEIRKGGGDDSALSDILVEYVDRLGTRMAKDAAEAGTPDGQAEMKKVMNDVESTILKKLGSMNVNADILGRMEERINKRMESILDNMRVQWLHTQSGQAGQDKPKMLTVLQTLEHNVGQDEELGAILKIVREKVDAGEIQENDFSPILDEIIRQKHGAKGSMNDQSIPEGILSTDTVMFFLEKEIARSRRFGLPFSALAFAFVAATPKTKPSEGTVTNESVLYTALEKLAATFRTTDYVGQIGKNKMLVLLPMAPEQEAKKALARVLRLLHAAPLDVNGVPVQLRVAGVAASYDVVTAQEANTFAKGLSNKLADMVSRIKNVRALF